MIDNRQLQSLVMVIQCGGFDKAATALFVTQSAISQRIKQLEEQIGQVLVVRTSPPRATDAGAQLLKYYRQVKCLEEELLSGLVSNPKGTHTLLPLGVNADSLSSWFFEIIEQYKERDHVLFQLEVDDQEETHKLLKNGDVVGCVSASSVPVKGCSCYNLGKMKYTLVANQKFTQEWFQKGFNYESACDAPTVIYNTKDTLHRQFFKKVFYQDSLNFNSHYVPSPDLLLHSIISGFGYGVVPEYQGLPYFRSEELIDLFPGENLFVNLYWHCWNINFKILENFTTFLIEKTSQILT